jgi:hypothetical protein
MSTVGRATRRSKYLAVGGLVLATVGTKVAAPAGAAEICRTVQLSWSTPSPAFVMTPWSNPIYDTGIRVPDAAAGETIRVTASSYVSGDTYPPDAPETREMANQLHEQWRLNIGGAEFGSLTADVPDSVATGATSAYSGTISGSFGTGPITSGAVLLRHASLYGFTESANSVRPSSFQLELAYCSADPEPTTTEPATTAPPPDSSAPEPSPTAPEVPTTPAAPESTAPPDAPDTTPAAPIVPLPAAPTTSTSAPPSTATVPPTSVPATTTTFAIPRSPVPGDTTTTIVTASTAPPTTATGAPPGSLPTTGGDPSALVQAGFLLLVLGLALRRVRRAVA